MKETFKYGEFFGSVCEKTLESSKLEDVFLNEYVVEAFGKMAVDEIEQAN